MTYEFPPASSQPTGRGGSRWPLVALLAAVAVVAIAAVVLARRSDDGAAAPTTTEAPPPTEVADTTSAPSTEPAGPETTTTSAPVEIDPAATGGRTPLSGFGQIRIEVRAPDGRTCELCLLLAESPGQRSRGLMEVTDPSLGGYDGMLFDFGDSPGTGGFWMRNTRIPLESAFYDPDGRFLASFSMVPCPDETADPDCPRYGPDEPFGTVIELADLRPEDVLLVEGSTIEVVDGTCPAVLAGR